MGSDIDNIRSGLDALSEDVRSVLDSEISEEDLQGIRGDMQQLLAQSERYYKELKDKGENSRSEVSRHIANVLLNEECWSVNPLYNKEGFPKEFGDEDISSTDLDLEALYVEYLTGRAGQALRDAEMGELYLKIINYKKNNKGGNEQC